MVKLSEMQGKVLVYKEKVKVGVRSKKYSWKSILLTDESSFSGLAPKKQTNLNI